MIEHHKMCDTEPSVSILKKVAFNDTCNRSVRYLSKRVGFGTGGNWQRRPETAYGQVDPLSMGADILEVCGSVNC